ncbi:hypothetical protein BGW38_007625, partial [Lunasporangiospora selenospora]
ALLYFRANLQSTLLPTPASDNHSHDHIHDPVYHDNHQQFHSQTNEHRQKSLKDRRPTVPLTLDEFAALDDIAEAIVKVETHRVFNDGERFERIRGTKIQKNLDLVKTIRDQIDCWTQHGSWKRISDKELHLEQLEATGSPQGRLRTMGDTRFAKCDARFMDSLDRSRTTGNRDGSAPSAGHQEERLHVLGEYDAENERLMVREAVKYRWVPDEERCGPVRPSPAGTLPPTGEDKNRTKMGFADDRAEYRPFTPQKFCQVLNQRNMLVVGDLTQFQFHDLFLSASGMNYNCFGELGCLHKAPHDLCPRGGGFPAQLKYARNDVLSVPSAFNPEDDEYPNAMTVEQPWASSELLKRYKIVFLNKGLFWQTDDEFLTELVFTMKYMWKFYPDNLVIYRATHPVSSECLKMKNEHEDEAIASKDGLTSVVPGTILQRPLTETPRRESDNQGRKPVYRPTLADIQRQNKLARAVIESAGGIFLDTEAMFGMRPDGRLGNGDCSRFCAPGPLDAYTDLLYNTLRILQS